MLLNNYTDLKGLFQIKCIIFVMKNLTPITKLEKFITFIHETGTNPKAGGRVDLEIHVHIKIWKC